MGNNQKNNNIKNMCCLVCFTLVIALVLEFGFFVFGEVPVTSGTLNPLIQENSYDFSIVGYEVQGDYYGRISEDPQLVFTGLDCPAQTVLVDLGEPLPTGVITQVFYSVNGSGFSEEQSVIHITNEETSEYLIIELGQENIDALRVDINASFSLDEVSLCDSEVVFAFTSENAFDILRVSIMAIAFFLVFVMFLNWWYKAPGKQKLTAFELLFCVACFVYYFLWAIEKPFNYAPDELMRYDVTKFLFEHNRLPVGDELLSIWGFSYAHLPTVLCNQMGYVVMKIASVFSEQEFFLLVAARMVSVFCGTGSVFFLIKTGKQVCNPFGKWIMVVLVAAMPQFAFLSSYINNDIVAFLGITMILYAWTLGLANTWGYGNATILAIGISICGLAYYNSYAWVLLSIFFFFITYNRQRARNNKELIRLTTYIVVVVFVLIGYSFIRHIVLYGDLLGFKTSRYYGELYAIDSLKASNRITCAEQNMPVLSMLFEHYWLKITWRSFIGYFGYMEFSCPQVVYDILSGFILIGVLGFITNIVEVLIKHKGINRDAVILYFSSIISALITLTLSIYNSYFTDFQAQGRYIYPAFPALALVVSNGYAYWIGRVKTNSYRCAISSSICTAIICLSVYVYGTVYLPS